MKKPPQDRQGTQENLSKKLRNRKNHLKAYGALKNGANSVTAPQLIHQAFSFIHLKQILCQLIIFFFALSKIVLFVPFPPETVIMPAHNQRFDIYLTWVTEVY